jgi:hypothetical protein
VGGGNTTAPGDRAAAHKRTGRRAIPWWWPTATVASVAAREASRKEPPPLPLGMGVPAFVPALSRPLLEWLTAKNPQDGSDDAAVPVQETAQKAAPQHVPHPLDSGLSGNLMDADVNDVGLMPRRAVSPRPRKACRWKRNIAQSQGQSDMGSDHQPLHVENDVTDTTLGRR